MAKRRKFPMKNYNSELARLFKKRMDELEIYTWGELEQKVGMKQVRAYTDFFSGQQYLTKDVLEKTFEVLGIPIEDLEKYVTPITKYKIIPIDPNGKTCGRENYRQTEEYKQYQHNFYKRHYREVIKPRRELEKRHKEFIKDRNEAILSMDKDKIIAYSKKYDIPIPDNDKVFWAAVHKVICNVFMYEDNSPVTLEQYTKSYDWLAANGFSPIIK